MRTLADAHAEMEARERRFHTVVHYLASAAWSIGLTKELLAAMTGVIDLIGEVSGEQHDNGVPVQRRA
jgi:hypothetical protein